MKREKILKKLNTHFDNILEQLDEIAALLEIDMDDDELAEMSVCFREHVVMCMTENEGCNYSDIVEYINENL